MVPTVAQTALEIFVRTSFLQKPNFVVVLQGTIEERGLVRHLRRFKDKVEAGSGVRSIILSREFLDNRYRQNVSKAINPSDGRGRAYYKSASEDICMSVRMRDQKRQSDKLPLAQHSAAHSTSERQGEVESTKAPD
jgi:hypothetical protein